jgi:transmembrane sensor
MERFSPFIDLTSEELAVDESFQSYVFRRNKDDIRFWEAFIERYPERQGEVDGAVEILTVMAFKKKETSQQSREFELHRLLSCIAALETSNKTVEFGKNPGPRGGSSPVFMQVFFGSRWSRLAASATGLLILLSAGFFLTEHYFRQDTLRYETQYGENMTIQLPDSSLVTLNGNTRLTLHEDWDSKDVREVWLDGEAFFDVRKKGNSPDGRFTVHTSGMDVEVLGTRFNVFNRDDKANVVLNSGKVKLRIASATDTSSVLMNPDEAVEFVRKDHTIIKKQVNAELLTSWRNKILVFENTPLYKIGEMIEYNYGMEVIFDGNVDQKEALAGTIPSENLDVLLTVLAKSSGLNITRNNNQIIIEKLDPVSTSH